MRVAGLHTDLRGVRFCGKVNSFAWAHSAPNGFFMVVTREELNPCTIQLKIEVASDDVRGAFDRAFKKLTKGIKIPGFRPGAAPKHMLEQAVDPNRVTELAADIIVRDNFSKALEQEKLEPHSQPSISIEKLDLEEAKCEFTAKVPLPPKVELGDYRKLSATFPAYEVSDDEVEQQVDELRKGRSTRQAVVDRGIQPGDVAVLNIRVEGEAEGRNFMTIAGQTFKDLDEAIVGLKPDEIKSLELTFPENFQEKDWAGKKHKAHVSVRSISAQQLPQLDDAFAQSLNLENLDELKVRVRAAIERAKQSIVDDYVNEQLLESLLEQSQVAVPDTMWEQVAMRRLNDLAAEQANKGKTMEQYAEETGMSIEELIGAWQDEAKTHVKRAVIVQKIFELESMQLSDADLNRELFDMAREYNTDPKDLFEAMRKQGALSELQFRSVFRKVTDFLRSIADLKATEEEATAKSKKSKKS